MAESTTSYVPFHDDAFPELHGNATHVVVSVDEQWIAVSSVLHRSSRVALFRTTDLSCAHLLTFTMDAESIAFHPTLPLLAIGLDNGDECDREGGLTLLEPDTGHRVDFADPDWGIESARWADDRTLELISFAVHPEDEYEHLTSRTTVVRDNWLGLAPDALDLTALDRTSLAPDTLSPYDLPLPQPLLRALAERAGRTYDARGGVRSVAGLRDGRVLATRAYTAVECWAPDGSLLWSVPASTARGGARIEVADDERTVRVAVSGPDARTWTDFLLVATFDGTVLDRCSVPFSAALCARTDGVWAIRDTYDRSFGTEPPTPPNTRIFAADGTPLGAAHEPDRYDLVPLDVRRCPELLYGRRRRDVIALDPTGTVETVLFTVDAPLGRAVYADDTAGQALLHGRTELVRRAFPSGEVIWSRPLDSDVIDLDTHDGVLYALCADDTLVSCDTADGAVIGRRALPRYGPLSLHAGPDGTILVGTAAGQIMRFPADTRASTGRAGR
ncbi:hypothetical protein [Streptomyces sp. NPDC056527]|uniref:hypothetical protein n=1 Tax=Streptomyces sp. NPDC056527 TaxID=3345853 RepID=UPI00367B9E4F